MNNKILNITMDMDTAQAINEVERVAKKIDEIYGKSRGKSGGKYGGMKRMISQSEKLENSTSQVYKNINKFNKAMQSGTLKEQAKTYRKLRKSLKELGVQYNEMNDVLGVQKGGYKEVNQAIRKQIKATKKAEASMADYYQQAVKQRSYKPYHSIAIKTGLPKYQTQMGAASNLAEYKKVKQEQQEIIQLVNKIGKKEQKINNIVRQQQASLGKYKSESMAVNSQLEKQVNNKKEMISTAIKEGQSADKIKRIHSELISLQKKRLSNIGKFSKMEEKERGINARIRNREEVLNKVVASSEKYSEVIAGEIIPANIKNTKIINDARSEMKRINAEIDKQINNKKQMIAQAAKEGASAENIEAIHRDIVNLEQKRLANTREISKHVKREKTETKGMSRGMIRLRKVTKYVNAAFGIFTRETKKATKSQSKLGIKVQKTSSEIIRQGGSTRGLLRTFSRWRNRILVATFAMAGLVRGMQRMIKFAVEARKQFIALNKVASNLGISTTKTTEAAKSLAEDGLVSLKEASQSIKALVATGAPLKTVINNLNKMKDAAIANGRAGYSVGQNLVAYARGVKQMRSQLADAAGVMKNIGQILQEHPDWVSRYGEATALLKGYTEEAQRFAGVTEEMLKTLPGMVQALRGQFKLLSTEIGDTLAIFSEKFVVYFLKKIKEIREKFAEKEGILYSWASTFGNALVDIIKVLENLTPDILRLVNTLGAAGVAFLSLVEGASKLIDAFSWLLGNFGAFIGKFLAAKTAAFMFGSIIYKVIAGVKSLTKSLVALNIMAQATRASMATIGSWIKTVMPIAAAIGTLVGFGILTYIVEARKEQAKLTNEIRRTNEAWRNMKSGALDVAEALDKIAKKHHMEKKEVIEEAAQYSYLTGQIENYRDTLSDLRKGKAGLGAKIGPGVPAGFIKQRKKGVEIDKQISNIQEELKKDVNKRSSILEDIVKLHDKINKEYNATLNKEKGTVTVVNKYAKSLRESVDLTFAEFIRWTEVNQELSKALSGVQEINQEIVQMESKAEKAIRTMSNEIKSIKFSDKYSKLVDIQVEYNKEIRDYRENIDKLVKKRAVLTEKELKGKKALKDYVDLVDKLYSGNMDPNFAERVFDRLRKSIPGMEKILKNISEEAKANLNDLIASFIKGEKTIEQVTKTVEESFKLPKAFSEEKFETSLNNLRKIADTQKEVNRLTEVFSEVLDTATEKRKAQLDTFMEKWEESVNEMKDSYESQISQIKSEVRFRGKSVDLVKRKTEALKEQTKITDDIELQIRLQELRIQYDKEVLSTARKYNSLISERKEKIKGFKREAKKVADSVDELSKPIGLLENVDGVKDKVLELNATIEKSETKLNDAERKYAEMKAKGEDFNKQAIKNLKERISKLKDQRNAYKWFLGASKEYNQLGKEAVGYENKKLKLIKLINEERKAEKEYLKWRDLIQRRSIEYYEQFIEQQREGITTGGFMGSLFNMMTRQGQFQKLGAAEKKMEEYPKKIVQIKHKIHEASKKEDDKRIKELRDKLKNTRKLYETAKMAEKDFWQNTAEIMKSGVEQAVNIGWNYVSQRLQMHQELEAQEAAWVAKNKYYKKQQLLTQEEFEKRRTKWDEYRVDQEKLNAKKLSQALAQQTQAVAMELGKQLVIQGGVSLLSELAGPGAQIAVGAALMAGGGLMAISGWTRRANVGVARQQALMEARKETGAYGSAFESPETAAGGGGGGSTASTAGSTVNAAPRTININPTIEFNGETMMLTPHGDMVEVGEALSDTIKSEIEEAFETGEIDLSNYV